MKMFRRSAYIICALLVCSVSRAQDDFARRFNEFTRSASGIYSAFTDSVNAAFAETLKLQWERFTVTEGDERNRRPVPVQVDTIPERDTCTELPVMETVRSSSELKSTDAVFFYHHSSGAPARNIRFLYCGTPMSVSVPSAYGTFHPKGITEEAVSSFWREIAGYDFNALVSDFAACRRSYGLNDWAVLGCVMALSEALYPENICSERAVFTVFLLNQMGMKARIARNARELCCLFPSVQQVYARKYVMIDGCPHYIVSGSLKSSELFTYRTEFGHSCHSFDLRIQAPPALGVKGDEYLVEKKSSVFANKLTVPLNKAVLSFYGDYPQVDPVIQASACPYGPFEEALFAQVQAALSDAVSVRDKLERILRFVQADFKYQVDMEQFGYERPFFVEENFSFECSDCEDRAVLMNRLVRGVLGLRTVLLDYPDHFAIAVELPEEIRGDFVRVGGCRFYVCDPSYIGAPVGVSMPEYRIIPAKIWEVH